MRLAPIEFLRTRWSWRWSLLALAVLILVSASVFALKQPVYYRSETRILVEPETVFDGKLSPVEARDSIETQVRKMQQMVESRTFLARIIEQFRLFGFGSEPDFHVETAIANLRSNLRLEVAGGDTVVLSFFASDPQSARDVTKRIAESLLQANIAARKNAVIERDQFIDEQLRRVERDLAAIDEKVAQFKPSYPGSPQQQAMLREQARLVRHVDELDRMKFSSQMAASLATDINNERFRILDEANLPDRPMSPAWLHIFLMGVGATMIVALPAASIQKKAPRESA